MNKHPYGIIVLASVFFLLPSLTDGKAKKVMLSNQLINKLRHMRKWPNRTGREKAPS